MQPKVSARAARVWMRLGSWYGARLGDAYGTSPPEDWVTLIDRTDDERLEQGLAAVRRETPVHPPTFGQFEAAIPAKRFQSTGEDSPMTKLCEWIVRNRTPCAHQVAARWSWFGPMQEFVSTNRGKEVVKHPNPRGVVVPPCAECNRPSMREFLPGFG